MGSLSEKKRLKTPYYPSFFGRMTALPAASQLALSAAAVNVPRLQPTLNHSRGRRVPGK
jgi:hypothetical protein